MKQFITTLLMLLAAICQGQEIEFWTFSRQNVAGDYSVRTTLTVKANNRFTYEFDGHLLKESAEGSFRTNTDDKVITLTYDSLNQNDYDREFVEMSPKEFKYSKNRLYEIDENGRPIKSRKMLSRYRRFYIFGDFNRRRKVFLERVKL